VIRKQFNVTPGAQRAIYILLFTAFAMLMLNSWWNRGPKYQGKPARYWARHCAVPNQDAAVLAGRALRNLGAQTAVPALLDEIQSDRKLLRAIWPYLPRALRSRVTPPGVFDERQRRLVAFISDFGEGAAPAVPLLTRMLQSPSAGCRVQAAQSLGQIGVRARSALPALEAAMRSPDPILRNASELAIHRIASAQSAAPQAVVSGAN
jgi:HEAT repeat protein